jgi:DNA-binding transcriptional LysR family regulator
VVADELNFRRAAERLYIAQPAVSQQIASLEKVLGIRLLDRDNRAVRLTDAGQVFLPACLDILGSVESAELLARNAGSGEYGKIRFGFNAGFTGDHLVDLVRALRGKHPHLELSIQSSRHNHEILRSLREDALDVGLVGGPVAVDGLLARTLSRVRLCVTVAEGHRLAGHAVVRMEELRDEVFILTPPAPGWSLRRMVDDVLDHAGFQPREVIHAADAITVLTLVSTGIGVAFATERTVSTTPRHVVLIPLAEESALSTSLVWKSGRETRALRNVIRAAEECLVEAADPDAAPATG